MTSFKEIATEIAEVQRVDASVFVKLATAEPDDPEIEALETDHERNRRRIEDLFKAAAQAECDANPLTVQGWAVLVEAMIAEARDAANGEGFDHPALKRAHDFIRKLESVVAGITGVDRRSFGLCLEGLDISDELLAEDVERGDPSRPALKRQSASEQLVALESLYRTLKTAYPNAILMFRMGQFFECFFEDAVLIAGALGIVLSHRGKHVGHQMPMAGIPCQSIDHHGRTLASLGHEVMLCFPGAEDGGIEVELAHFEPRLADAAE